MSCESILREGRARANVTKKELSERLGITQNTYNSRVTNKTLTLWDMSKIAKWLGLTDAEIIQLIRGTK